MKMNEEGCFIQRVPDHQAGFYSIAMSQRRNFFNPLKIRVFLVAGVVLGTINCEGRIIHHLKIFEYWQKTFQLFFWFLSTGWADTFKVTICIIFYTMSRLNILEA